MTTPHRIFNPPELADPVGFSHAVEAAPGRTIYLGGQTAHDSNSKITTEDIAEQFGLAAANVAMVLEAAGAKPEHLVSLQIYVTDASEYRSALKEIGAAYSKYFGNHYPAMALFEIKGLFDPAARVELVGIAVVPE